jgi:nucleoside 2-deoxyribosyltransferase
MGSAATDPTPRVYLAGPTVFLPDARAVGRRLVEACKGHGLEGLFPLDNEIPKGEPAAMAEAIYRANLRMIDRADGVLADIGPFRGAAMDPGTAFEIGYAVAQQKPVVCYSDDLRPYLDRVRALEPATRQDGEGSWHDGQGLGIEDFGLVENLMIAVPAQAILGSFEEALKVMAGLLAT